MHIIRINKKQAIQYEKSSEFTKSDSQEADSHECAFSVR